MLQSELTQAKESAKLRWFDNKTKSKILLTIKWSLLGGNKQPYLSVDIKQVKKNGLVIHDWQEKKETLKELNKDFYDLAVNHLINLSCEDSNVEYHFKQTKDQFGKEIYTREQHNNKLKQLWEHIENHSIFEVLFKSLGESLHGYLNEYKSKTNDCYKYIDAERAFKHWDQQIAKRYNTGILNIWSKPIRGLKEGLTPQEQLKDYFQSIEGYKNLENDYKYKNLPSKRELWTPETLANYYNLPLIDVYTILSRYDMTSDLELIKNKIQENKNKRLTELTKKYNIPLVIEK